MFQIFRLNTLSIFIRESTKSNSLFSGKVPNYGVVDDISALHKAFESFLTFVVFFKTIRQFLEMIMFRLIFLSGLYL